MKNSLAAVALFLYAVSSGGVVLVEYSCHETGTSGVTVPEARACYAPICEGEASGETDPCCDHACCEIDMRVQSPSEQIAGHTVDHGGAVDEAAAPPELIVALDHAVPASDERPPTTPFPGFDRPVRI